MRDPTAEERATDLMDKHFIGHEDSWEDWTDENGKELFVNDHYFIAKEIRDAVAEETERCAVVAKEFLSLPSTPRVSVEDVKTAIAAAIRKEPDGE